MAKFIKVTPKGENEPRIVLASLKTFYISQGAKIETPTEEEVYSVEPNERPAEIQKTSSRSNQTAEIARIQKELDAANKANAELTESIETYQQTIANLKEKLATCETEIADEEKAIESLRKELAKALRKSAASSQD